MIPRSVVWAMAWAGAERLKIVFGCEDVAFEFESFRCRCLIRVGNIGLEFSREVWTGDTDLKFISILVITKAKEVNHLSQG